MTNPPAPRRWARRGASTWLALALLGAPSPAAAQGDALERGKTLYAAASYEEALAALVPLESAEAAQYRALCQLALGDTAEVERTLEALVTAAPEFIPRDADLPPRFAAVYAAVRRKVLPSVLKEAFAEGRAHFQAKAFDEARARFSMVVLLSGDPTLGQRDDVKDLRLLAEGFLQLAAATTVVTADGARADERRASPPATAPEVAPAVKIAQVLPPWPANLGVAPEGKGVIRVQIGADGRVQRAALEAGLHPQYDARVLAAAASWRYKPAMLNGTPVASESVVSYVITP